MSKNRLFYSKKVKQWLFICPGCQSDVSVGIHSFDAGWNFNGDLARPTVSPSILVTSPRGTLPRCHSFIRNGQIQYLDDCEHALAGQTVEIPVWDRMGDY